MIDEFPELSDAMNMLETALEQLEELIELQGDQTIAVQQQEGEIQRMNADRSQLALELDLSQARVEKLRECNLAVSRRLVTAMESIREIVGHEEG